MELISRHHNNPLVGHFGIEKTSKLLAWKYYWLTLCHDVEAYVKDYDICLAYKAVCDKLYSDLQLLSVPTHQWKHLLMDFVTGLLVSIDWKENNYNSILVSVNWVTKMVYYKLVKITLNAPRLAEVIINILVRHYGLLDSIIINRSSLFISKFWSLPCYCSGIKRRLSTAFYPQTDGQTQRQNSTIEEYLPAFVNFEQNNWARLLLMAKFAYNNTKNSSTGHTLFELNCGYHLCVFFEEDTNLCS